MDFTELVGKRRMVRNFSDESIDDEVLERILDIGQRGPSAGFTQGQDFIVVTDPEMKLKLAELCTEESYVSKGFDPFISKAPVLIIPCTNEGAYHRRYQQADKVDEEGKEIDWPVPYWFMDVGHAVMLVLLAVVNEDLAAGFAGFKQLQKAKDVLGIPEEVTPMGVIPIGHPAPDKRSPSLKRGRRKLTNTVHREKW
jgi:nitroreductase